MGNKNLLIGLNFLIGMNLHISRLKIQGLWEISRLWDQD
jgi:hypothetical protein